MKDEWPAIPCGLIAKSIFNDYFELWKVGATKKEEIDESNIAWDTDVKYQFKNIEDSEIPDLENV